MSFCDSVQGDSLMTDPNDRPRRRPIRPPTYDIELTGRSDQNRYQPSTRDAGRPPVRDASSRSGADLRGNGNDPSNGGFLPYRSNPAGRAPQPNRSPNPNRNPQPNGRRTAAGRPQPGRSRRRSGGNRLRGFAILMLIVLVVAGVLLFKHYRDSYAGASAAADKGSLASNNPVNGGNAAVDTSRLLFSNDAGKPLSGKLILLDPGHGGQDSGCVYPATDPAYIESTINLGIAEKTKSALEDLGATVVLLRSDNAWISLYNRISKAHLYSIQYADQMGIDTLSDTDKARLIDELSDTISINSDAVDSGGMGIMAGTGVGADLSLLMDLESNLDDVLYLSIHINSNQYSDLHGTQIYYVTDDSVIKSEENTIANDSTLVNNPDFPIRDPYYGRDSGRNAALAECLYQSIMSSAPEMETNAVSTNEDNYAVLREHNLTGALIEVGFITNKSDRGYLSDDRVTDTISQGIADGCVNFFSANS